MDDVGRALRVVLVQPAAWSEDGPSNMDAVMPALARAGRFDAHTLVVLPELVGATTRTAEYLRGLRDIVAASGAWVVGGSHYGETEPLVNSGLVLAPDGSVVDHYEKRNPYGIEHDHGVQPGDRHACFLVDGRSVTVMICADAWFAELLLDPPSPTDLIIVPSFSITRRPPAFARALWRHLAVARAYEFSAFVAVSDWRQGATYHGSPSAGVSGVADPFPDDPERYFRPAAERTVSVHALDLAKLDGLRRDRLARGFARLVPG
jgi:predicted amidohydrolase